MACRFAVLLMALLAAPASGARPASFLGFAEVRQEMQKCGPQTKLEMSGAADAAGTAVFAPVEALVDGECVPHGASAMTINAVKFCGPGKLTLSRMSCDRS